MTGPEQAAFCPHAPEPGGQPVTEYGFVGRGRDIQAIGPDEFAGLVTADLPADLGGSLTAAIEAADRPVVPDGRNG